VKLASSFLSRSTSPGEEAILGVFACIMKRSVLILCVQLVYKLIRCKMLSLQYTLNVALTFFTSAS
jgi:hypothetical protein